MPAETARARLLRCSRARPPVARSRTPPGAVLPLHHLQARPWRIAPIAVLACSFRVSRMKDGKHQTTPVRCAENHVNDSRLRLVSGLWSLAVLGSGLPDPDRPAKARSLEAHIGTRRSKLRVITGVRSRQRTCGRIRGASPGNMASARRRPRRALRPASSCSPRSESRARRRRRHGPRSSTSASG